MLQSAKLGSALSNATKAKLRSMKGTRNDASGVTATIFGCTGFLGRYVVSELGRMGVTCVLPYRGDETEVRDLKVMADLGNIANIPFNVRDVDSVKRCIEGSDVVINLMGKHYRTKHALPWWINYTLDDVHVTAARTIAQACTDLKISKLIHHSALVAAPDSPSVWAASKYRGELAVSKAYPTATIVRSSVIYGPEDRFLNWYANRMLNGFIPLVDGGAATLSPVFVNDVASALLAVALDTNIHSRTFELVGDDDFTHKEVAEFVCDVTKHDPRLINVPTMAATAIGQVMEQFPNPLFTADEAILRTLDQVKRSEYPGLRELDIIPSSMEKEAFSFLLKYNRGGHFQQVSGYHD